MEQALLLNIGNTHCEAADWTAADGLTKLRQWPTAEAPVEFDPVRQIVCACVSPDLRTRLAAANPRIHWVDGRTDAGVDFSGVNRETLGADRAANAIAAARLLPLPALIIDSGTAVTIEIIDADRCFRGGAILPGRQLARQALNQGTGQLPLTTAPVELPPAIGCDTPAAIAAGVDRGVLGAVQHLIAAARQELGSATLTIVAVGGDRDFFAAHLDEVETGPDNFTLQGIAIVAEKLDQPPS